VIEFRVDDLSGEASRALVARHLAGMYATSPPKSVHALGMDKLRQPGITFWSGWVDGEIAVCGALKRIDAARCEIKSMRVADAWLGKGVGRAMLEHIMNEARRMGFSSIWLETGSSPEFMPALKLYESAAFVYCGPFEGYTEDPFSIFMTREL
jgi:putative acetyltransferase